MQFSRCAQKHHNWRVAPVVKLIFASKGEEWGDGIGEVSVVGEAPVSVCGVSKQKWETTVGDNDVMVTTTFTSTVSGWSVYINQRNPERAGELIIKMQMQFKGIIL